MRDRAPFWTPATRPEDILLEGDWITLRGLPPLPQVMVSGDLDAYRAAHDLPEAVGLLAEAEDPHYAVRLARRRMLVVGTELSPRDAGWSAGCATSPMTGALAAFEITGPRAMDLVARATALDPYRPSPSAALLFAGMQGVLYRHGEALRLHIDRGLAAYLANWAAATSLFPDGADAAAPQT
ncbi:hypothetical protein [Pseudooceanicola marinus]|uniref:hypothetical protein n=1 Tax=Pseudooceanicola marinus TaxID=396013 RepID=UPI001CD531FF|nr:hypothetical protein [Pseudooceanicola marinus]MCA1336547.1 hypothetical protein [Pseudooceanicola marinus]